MAGGMGRKGDRVTLHERIHGTPPPTQATAGRFTSGESPTVKHCWVTDRHGRLPGLLLEWRHVAAGWQGRVVRPVLEAGVWIVVEEWLPAELLEQG
jgi:hypothetical protein